MLKEQKEVEWTLFNIGWLADYFLPKEHTYMKPVPLEFPVDANGWRAHVRGTGDEGQSWTCARDVARAVVELCKANEWVGGNASLRLSQDLHLKPSGYLGVSTSCRRCSYRFSRRLIHT